MKLIEALELGTECGLETVKEALDNVVCHAPMLFRYDEMNAEIKELYDEVTNLYPYPEYPTHSLDTNEFIDHAKHYLEAV